MSETIGRRRAQHGMGLLSYEDEDDLLFRMAENMDAGLGASQPVYTDILYKTGPILNQGNQPRCVGYSLGQWLVTEPIINLTGPTPDQIYCGAQLLDPFPGDCTNPITQGTALRSGAKFLQKSGYIGTYLWSWDAAVVRDWMLAGKGPVVVGTNWYASMQRPLAGSYRLNVNTASQNRGGHAYLLSGYLSKTQSFRVTNSWGVYWGQKGHAWLRFVDLQKLFGQRGEAITAVELTPTQLGIEPEIEAAVAA